MTPRERIEGSIRARKVYAPRNLNAPPRWSISGFTKTGPPTAASRSSERSSGVRTATPAIAAAAARKASSATSAEEEATVTGCGGCGERSGADSVATAVLRLVEIAIRLFEQLLSREGVGPARVRDTHRDRDLEQLVSTEGMLVQD